MCARLPGICGTRAIALHTPKRQHHAAPLQWLDRRCDDRLPRRGSVIVAAVCVQVGGMLPGSSLAVNVVVGGGGSKHADIGGDGARKRPAARVSSAMIRWVLTGPSVATAVMRLSVSRHLCQSCSTDGGSVHTQGDGTGEGGASKVGGTPQSPLTFSSLAAFATLLCSRAVDGVTRAGKWNGVGSLDVRARFFLSRPGGLTSVSTRIDASTSWRGATLNITGPHRDPQRRWIDAVTLASHLLSLPLGFPDLNWQHVIVSLLSSYCTVLPLSGNVPESSEGLSASRIDSSFPSWMRKMTRLSCCDRGTW
mmetsp:Transcript_16302/g.32789  ORF Transcript_16302/g.32789 Transcript_16302/m.32789 type:complete len:308 (-) Transcript_16302:581-1504(-)